MDTESHPFLTASWNQLVVVNYEVEPGLLLPRVPAGTTLDLYQGMAFVSLVAFKFDDTKLLGVLPTPPSPSFEEINLRFYVRRAERRAVSFVREIVPSRLVAWTARALYEEPYEQHPTESTFIRHDPNDATRGGRVGYAWRSTAGHHRIEATTRRTLRHLTAGSLEEFVLEHYWGYTQRSDGTTSEYEVRHPPWRYWDVATFHIDPSVAAFYGAPFEAVLTTPHSAFVAEGSEISVHSGHRLERAAATV